MNSVTEVVKVIKKEEREKEEIKICNVCGKLYVYEKELEKCENIGQKNAIKRKLCLECYNKIPSSKIDKENYEGKIIYFKCPYCNFEELIKSNTSLCPNCYYNFQTRERRKFTCKICNKELFLSDQEKLCNYNEVKLKLINNGYCLYCCYHSEYKEDNFNDKNSFNVEIDINSDKIPRVIHMHKCPNTNNIRINKCPDNRYKCPDCSIIHNSQVFSHICGNPECGYKEDTFSCNWTCPKCQWNGTKYQHKCTNLECNYEESNFTPANRWTCPKCGKMPNQQTFKHKCLNCGYECEDTKSNLMWTCPECNYNATYDFLREGINCNQKCIHFEECNYKENRTKNIYGYCYNSYMENYGFLDEGWFNFNYEIECNKTCKEYNKCNDKNCLKNKFGWCKYMLNIWTTTKGVQDKNWRKYDLNIVCNKKCPFLDNCKNKLQLKNKWGYCETCVNNLGSKPNFVKLDILTYKNEPVYQILEKLDSGEYDLKDFPGFNKRWCSNCNKLEWHYDTDCLICETGKHLRSSQSSIQKWCCLLERRTSF